jgi:hypothetical protein
MENSRQVSLESIGTKIIMIRGERVTIDRDLAELYPDEIRLGLLCDWVAILYGDQMSEKLNIRRWYSDILEYQEKMNRRSRLDPWATSYLFEPTIEAIIRILSEKLPVY